MDINDLSSKLLADMVPERCYKPATAQEAQEMASLEKIPVVIEPTRALAARHVARLMASTIEQSVASRGCCVICSGGGEVDLQVGSELVKLVRSGKVSLENCEFFLREEISVLTPASQGTSSIDVVRQFVLDKMGVSPEHVHPMPHAATLPDLEIACRDYEQLIASYGGIDVALCQMSPSGGIGFNQKGSTANSRCRPVLIDVPPISLPGTDIDGMVSPGYCATVGMSTLLAARHMLLTAFGDGCAKAVAQAVEGTVSPDAPASFTQMHTNAVVALDLEAASQLTRIGRPWLLTRCHWTPRMACRAVTWLSRLLGKPVFRLNSQDYAIHLLNDLAAAQGSVAATNTAVGTRLNNTLTNWPGGCPDADDTFSPERSVPRRKRVLVLSPHPDDAVFAMGGTIARLVQQGHDVHVAICTTGDLAVDDADVRRMATLCSRLNAHYGADGQAPQVMLSSPAHMRYAKGRLVVSEAMTALRVLGVKAENVSELHLPFYTESPVGYGTLGEADVQPMVDAISSLEPHQIFACADFGDRFGTHRLVASLLVEALGRLRNEPFMQQCRVWLYRGLRSRWHLCDVDMAVPLSPADYALKRRSVLCYQSQVRLSPAVNRTGRALAWQRALHYGQRMAQAYSAAGLATYEAVESFMRMWPLHGGDSASSLKALDND